MASREPRSSRKTKSSPRKPIALRVESIEARVVPAIIAGPPETVTVTQQRSLSDEIGTFTDTTPNYVTETAAYSAIINWGDGTTADAGTVTGAISFGGTIGQGGTMQSGTKLRGDGLRNSHLR